MPTDRQQRCKKCGERFTRVQGTSRLYCFDCRPERKSTTNLRFLPQKGADSQNGADSGESGPIMGKLTRLTTETLDNAGILDTWQGAAAVTLAELIDAGKHGASGAAGTIKAHREAMAIALAIGETEEADVIELIFGSDGG